MEKIGIQLVIKEREDQLIKHSYTIANDAINYPDDELVQAALAIISESGEDFPEDWTEDYCEKLLRKPRNEQLAIAAAFLAAQIDVNFYNERF